MAQTISYDGYGVVANADRETNDTGGSATGDWGELGGGTIGFNPDVYLFEGGADGAGSMGSKYASKSGYSYVDGITALDFTTASANAEDNFLYCLVNIQSAGAFAPLATDGLSVAIGDSTGTMNHYKIAGSDDANGWSGGWKCFVIDPQITPSIDNSAVLTAIDTIGIWIDTDISVRADSIFQSMIISAKGIKFTGSPTVSGEGWDELATWCTDYANRAFSFIEVRGSTYFLKGGLTVGDGSISTTMSADGNSIEYEETSFWSGSAWVSTMPSTSNYVNVLANASIDWTNVSISGFVDNKLILNTSAGTGSSLSGGNVKLLQTLTTNTSDTFDGTVFSESDALTLSNASYDNCTFSECATQTLDATTTSFTGNIFKPASGVTALETPSLDYFSVNNFISAGTGHAVELTATGTYDWDSIWSGYGSTGTTDAVVYNNSGGAVTINVVGGDTPTYRNGTSATTSVVTAFTLTLTDIPSGVNVTIVNSSTRTELKHVESTGADITYAHGGGETVDILLNSLSYDPNLSDIYDLTLPNVSSSIKFQMISDTNYNNPT